MFASTFVNSIEITFAKVEGGSFLQGVVGVDALARDNEKPAHWSQVKPFYMSVYPITQKEYMKIRYINPSYFSKEGGGCAYVQDMDTADFPVESVSWDDAMEFCKRLSSIASEKEKGHYYRLPTESEWEFACRAGNNTIFANGDSFTSNDANINAHYPYKSIVIGKTLNRPCSVGLYKPNRFGLYDMHGNVWEWCIDTYKTYDSNIVQNTDARIARGGSWNCYSRFCRASYRCINHRTNRFYDCGFRIVYDIR